MVSYEVSIGLALGGVLMFAGTLRMVGIVEAQVNQGIWFVLALATTFGALRSVKERYLPRFRTFAFQFYGETIPEVESPWSFMNWEEETAGEPELAMGK